MHVKKAVDAFNALFSTIAVLFLLSACADKPPPLPKLSADAVIVAFGDSLTYGTGAGTDESYPAVLQQLTGRTVVNAGKPGELSGEGLRRLEDVLEEHQPALVILCHGGNDLLRKKDHDDIRQNVNDMILLAQQYGAALMLLGVPEPKLFSLQAAPFYEKLAEQHNLPIDTRIIPHIEGENSLKSDTIHPNAAGYRQIAETVRNLLQKTGAL
jgi:lysophospholipase L1-like esterase